MMRPSLSSRYRTGALLLIGVVVIGLAVGVVSAGDHEKVDLTQDHIVVESGETVVIEDRNTTTPTNFSVHEGGTLIIRNSTLFRIGEHHNDNEDFISGDLLIENSTIYGEDGIPIEMPTGKNATIIVTNSNLQHYSSKNFGVSIFFSGDYLEISNSSFGSVTVSVDPAVERNLSINDSKIYHLGLSVKGFKDKIEVRNFDNNITNMTFEKAGTYLRLTNVTLLTIPDIISGGSGSTSHLQDLRLIDSTARITVHPTSNFTSVNSTTTNPDIKFTNWNIAETYEFSGITKYGSFADKYIVNKPYLKMRWVNSSIPEWYHVKHGNMRHGAFGIENPGGGKNDKSTPDIMLDDSSIYAVSIGGNFTAQNITGDRLALYNNYGGNIILENSSFTSSRSLRIVQGANVTISGNASFEGAIQNFGELSYLNITRRYPVDLSNPDFEGATEKEIKVILREPNGTEIENTSYDPDTDFVFPEARYNLSNYKKSFTLTIQQGNRSTSRPLTLTTDTPIHVALSTPDHILNSLDAPEEVGKGEEFVVSVTVKNTKERELTENLTLTIGNAVEKTTEVSVAGGTMKTVIFENISLAAVGNYTLEVASANENVTQNLIVEEPGPIIVGSSPAQDLDADGLYEDVNGNGEFDIVDVQALFANLENSAVQGNVNLFDFNSDGEVDIVDVQALFANQ